MVIDILKVDFETEVGLIIVLQRHRTRKFRKITQNKGHYAVQDHSRAAHFRPAKLMKLPRDAAPLVCADAKV